MPNLKRFSVEGHRGFARAAMPTFTNVNNASIVTGVPPSVHGISGNFFFDPSTGEEVMMNSAKFLRCDTIFPAAARVGRKVAVVTAKEKLRDILAAGLIGAPKRRSGATAARPQQGSTETHGSNNSNAERTDSAAAARMAALHGIAFSSERANQAKKVTHGIDDVEEIVGHPMPPIYSADASLYVLKAGVALLEREMADFLYLSTTDYMQHKFAPDAPEVIEFYAQIDQELGRLRELGAIIGLTADHGMNAKQKADGTPNVIHLESLLAKKFGPGFRVILPITDPYVVHHGALGSFAVVHLPPKQALEPVRDWLMDLSGVTEVHDHATAARKLELPADRVGELVVLSGRDVVLGRTPDYHDLKALEGGLRSHGGRYEEMVPFIVSEPLRPEYAAKAAADPRNFDIFDFALNGIKTE